MTSPPHSIVFVITELEVGGAERCLVQVARGLDRTRFAPVVVSLAPRPGRSQEALALVLERHSIPIHFLGFNRRWQFPLAVRSLATLLRDTRPALVQSMLFHANVVTRWALRGFPQALWCAGIRVADPSRGRQCLERRALTAASYVVCVSQLVADYAADRLRVSRARLGVIPNGVDLRDTLSRAPADLAALGLPDSRRAITCVARLAQQKGIDRLLRAAPHVLQALPHHDVLVVGDGPEEARLRRLAREMGVAQRVHFCGWQPCVTEILLASDLLVLPSRWEGMPNVLLEAMACGRPVVCSPVEGVREVLGPLAEPQVVSASDPQAFSQKVVAIISAPQLAVELGEANRRRAAAEFSLETMVQRYQTLYTALVEPHEVRGFPLS